MSTPTGRIVERINRTIRAQDGQRRGARPPRLVRRQRHYLVRENQTSRKVKKARARIARAIARGGGAAL